MEKLVKNGLDICCLCDTVGVFDMESFKEGVFVSA